MTSDYVHGVISGVSDVASSVTYGVSGILGKVTKGVTDVLSTATSDMSAVVHDTSAGIKRILGPVPPDHVNCCNELESPGVFPNASNDFFSYSPSFSSINDDLTLQPDVSREDEEINIEIGLTEEHFCASDEFDFNQNLKGLEECINKCKALVLECDETSLRRRTLVHKLIQLRLRYEEAKEEDEIASSGVKFILGHQLHPKRQPLAKTRNSYCDCCAQTVWGLWHVSYICSTCEYYCHSRCLRSIKRRCGSLIVLERPHYSMEICPEIGLLSQNYRCFECHRTLKSSHCRGLFCLGDPFSKENAWSEPRICDYTGRYYCPVCHWNSYQVIPARVVHNWDFEERPVSRQTKQLLAVMRCKALLNLEKLNPELFQFVEELSAIKKLRQDVLFMKEYLSTCRIAQKNRLLRQLEERQHFVESSNIFSLQDLVDVNSGQLLAYLTVIHQAFSTHIKEECEICKGKGHICEVCRSGEVIFPFDEGTVLCLACSSCLHSLCYLKRNESCPKCFRNERRKRLVDSTTL